MPLLKKEPWTYPDDLLTSENQLGSEGSWWVLHTRPRAEKALARRLLGRSVSFFLPLYEKTWRSGGRKLTSFLPLFPGYLFLRGDDVQRGLALETNLVANTLVVKDQRTLHGQLLQVNRMILAEAPLLPEERLAPGTPVRLTAGPFAGVVGKIVSSGKQTRLVVEIELLNRGVSVPVEPWMIEVVGR